MNKDTKTNKEIIDALTDYFCDQDPRLIAQALAGCMLDINRLMHYSQLGPNEAECLQMRIKHNMEQLKQFIDGNRGVFTMKVFNSKEAAEECQ